MTYLSFLLVFIIPPILAIYALLLRTSRRNKTVPRLRPVLAMALVALLYTTPWDNYLVANRIWWYRADWVLGINLAWVPLEEYAFFILQTLLTGGSTLFVLGSLRPPNISKATAASAQRWTWTLAAIAAFAAALIALLSGPPRLTYVSLILTWALPPLALQAAFGADLLWQRKWHLLLSLAPPTAYLILADSVAIHSGTWIINPRLSLTTRIAGFPLEEALFFLITNLLIVVGLTLWISDEGRARALMWLRLLDLRRPLGSFPPGKTLPLPNSDSTHERA